MIKRLKDKLYCPQCGKQGLRLIEAKVLLCSYCEFTYYHNIAAATAGIIQVDDEVLLIRRANEPGLGKLGLPGGFIDIAEGAEAALRREIEEEVGFNYQGALSYFGCWPNQYHYKGIDYNTHDIYYRLTLARKPDFTLAAEEVSEIMWVRIGELKFDDLAFNSAKQALASL